ncbi:enoyl-CoA hydratase-related protein [Vallicoccus soli]|uniref:Enoyl-CoA hydratase n=1 Tax=Vallicoccus soli TaxID=2339232 RepID=A0A3A3Z8W3_9ACTN|nr:enoyl-CoA hydratase-related protein [Vallicoccus soli]RJK97506.1 enoyl-CoA hydratase [Vallicoccus soli]
MPGTAQVLSEVDAGVAVVTLNRPDRLNAVTQEMGEAYLAVMRDADADPAVRAVVVTGAGRGFCAGADLQLLAAIADGTSDADFPPDGAVFPPRLRKPVVAAVNGPCAGLGLVIALGADVRVAGPAATFTSSFARLGLVAEYGTSWLLPRLVGPSRALDLLLSARTVGAEEAERIGLVERLADDARATAVGYAQGLARSSSPRSMEAVKRQVWGDLARSREDAQRDAAALMRTSLTWPDLQEGLAALRERRAPDFPPLAAPDRPGGRP